MRCNVIDKKIIEWIKAGSVELAEKKLKNLCLNADGCQYIGYLYSQYEANYYAIQWIKKALTLAPHKADLWCNLSSLEIKEKQFDEALFSAKKGLEVNPEHSGLLLNAGVATEMLGWLEISIEYYQKSISKDANIAAFKNLGSLLVKMNRLDEALEYMNQGFQRYPENLEILGMRGSICWKAANYPDAASMFQKILLIDPTLVNVASDLGMILTYQGKIEEAIELFKKYLVGYETNKHINNLKWNLATPLLTLGNFKEGFYFYEYRIQLSEFYKKYREDPAPRWKGEPIPKKTLLVRCLQGVGDTFQFLRYVTILASKNIQMILELPSELHPLFSHLQIPLSNPESPPNHDLQVDIMSLPYIFKTDLDTIPPPISIQGGDLSPIPNRVGLAWRGKSSTPRDKHRSMSIKELEPLLSLKHLQFVSLQKELKQDEVELLNKHQVEIVNLNRFEDTLQALKSCSLVICVDTMVAHFSATLGIPTWIFLHRVPEWRWLLDRKSSPWYPSVTLFRQIKDDIWEDPIKEARKNLFSILS